MDYWHWREQPGAAGLSLPSRDFGSSALYQRGKANISSVKPGIELRLEPSRVSSCTFLAVAQTEGPSGDRGWPCHHTSLTTLCLSHRRLGPPWWVTSTRIPT